MPDLDHTKRTIAEWTERKLREAAALRIAARDASLSIMDELICHPPILIDKDLWVSADYREWSICLYHVGERIMFYVNELTLAHLAQKAPR